MNRKIYDAANFIAETKSSRQTSGGKLKGRTRSSAIRNAERIGDRRRADDRILMESRAYVVWISVVSSADASARAKNLLAALHDYPSDLYMGT